MALLPSGDTVHPKSRAEWRCWLSFNHGRTAGVWLISYKKATGKARIEYNEAVEEALCFGWIDSKPAKLDEARSMLWFSPRKARTNWSKLNKDRVESLVNSGLMANAGLEKVKAARKDGSWNALDAIDALVIPEDLQKALSEHPPAVKLFPAFPPSVKRGILEWIANAKRTETRAARIKQTAQLAAKNQPANQWRRSAS